MPRRLAQQRMILSDLEWPFYVSRVICAAAELLVSVATFNALVHNFGFVACSIFLRLLLLLRCNAY